MNNTVYIKYLRISSKKMKGLAKIVVGMPPKVALDRLSVVSGKAGRMMSLVVKSALANATNNMKLNAVDLRIKRIEVLDGPAFKRWQPVSRGMAHQIKKRTTHLRIELEEKKGKTLPAARKNSKPVQEKKIVEKAEVKVLPQEKEENMKKEEVVTERREKSGTKS